RLEAQRLDLPCAGAQRAAPRVVIEDGTVVVAEVPQQPPEPFGAAHRAVGDDEDAGADAGATRGGSERLRRRQRMPPFARRRGEVVLDVEKRRAWDVTGEIELSPAAGVAELPAAVGELVAHGRESRCVTEKSRGPETPQTLRRITTFDRHT